MRIVLSMLVCLYSFACYAQRTSPAHKETILTAASLKTGNSQDVLTSFYQLALTGLTGNAKSFDFQSSLFAIKAKTNPSLWKSLSYTKSSFSRNFVIKLSAGMDSNYRFSSNIIGLRYAIINKRDKTVYKFSLDREKEWNAIMNAALSKYLKSLNNNVKNPDFIKASNFFNDQNYSVQTAEGDLPPAFRDTLQAVINVNRYFSQLSLTQYQNHLQNSYDSLSKVVENKPLWVVNADFQSNSAGKLFTGMKFSTEYLQGLINNNAKSNLELHIKATTVFGDHITNPLLAGKKRGVFSAFAGFNWIALKNGQRQSVVELSGGLSENYVMSGLSALEDRITFTGEGTLRIRLTENLWVPFELSYDPKKGNVLGLISVKSNFNWLNAAKNYINN